MFFCHSHARLVAALLLLAALSTRTAAGHAAESQNAEIELHEVARDFSAVTFVTAYPGDRNALVVAEQKGRMIFLNPPTNERSEFLDIRNRVRSGGERGLLSVAFHPEYAKNCRLFLNYTEETDRLRTIIAEFRVIQNERRVDPESERRLLSIDQPYGNHNGGQIAFGPDGMLYIGMGDGGNRWDPQGHGQNLESLLGKMLRIDVDGETDGRPYRIPADNPFTDTARAKPEIWAYGLRNPWRFSFDRTSGELWAADVGQDTLEEIDIVRSGGNYGWRDYEGFNCSLPLGCRGKKYEMPVHVYGRSDGISITGGYVCRSCGVSSLEGDYLYGDFGSGKIWALHRTSEGKFSNRLLLESKLNISTFGEGGDGAIYLADHSTGVVLRVVAGK